MPDAYAWVPIVLESLSYTTIASYSVSDKPQ